MREPQALLEIEQPVDQMNDLGIRFRKSRYQIENPDVIEITLEDIEEIEAKSRITSEETMVEIDELAREHLVKALTGVENYDDIDLVIRALSYYCDQQFGFFDQNAGIGTLPYLVQSYLENPNPGYQDDRDCKLGTAILGQMLTVLTNQAGLNLQSYIYTNAFENSSIHPQLLVLETNNDGETLSGWLIDYKYMSNPNYEKDSNNLPFGAKVRREKISYVEIRSYAGKQVQRITDSIANAPTGNRRVVPFGLSALQAIDRKFVENEMVGNFEHLE